jgi:hypothetical protein
MLGLASPAPFAACKNIAPVATSNVARSRPPLTAIEKGGGMGDGGFLAPWFRDAGALTGLITGLLFVFKTFFEGRPFSYLEPDVQKGILKLYVLNSDKRSIVINASYILPGERWYIAPNASNMTSVGQAHTFYGAPESDSVSWRSHNVIIEPGKRHEFFLGSVDRDTKPTACFVLLSWQPLGGLSIPRLPVMLRKSRKQIEQLFRARKSKYDSDA